MHILVIKTFGYSIQTWLKSGILDRELSIYRNMIEKYDVEFTILSYGDDTDLRLIKDPSIDIFPIYKYVNKSKYKLIRIIQSLYFPFIIKKNIDSIDIIKQNQLLGSWVSILLKILIRKPLFIRTGYDMYTFAKHENKSYIKLVLYKLLTLISIQYSNLYSVSNKNDINKYKKYNVSLRRNWVIDNNYESLDGRFTNRILSVGRLENQKNYEYLIKEFKDSDFQLDIVGEGGLKFMLTNLASSQNVKINFLGKMSNEDLQDLYKKYKYYVSSSYFEGNPKTILEALSNSCVVIASNIKNHSELINDDQNGYLFDLKEGCLKSKFEQILASNLKQNEVAKNGYESVLTNNSISLISSDEYLDYKLLKK